MSVVLQRRVRKWSWLYGLMSVVLMAAVNHSSAHDSADVQVGMLAERPGSLVTSVDRGFDAKLGKALGALLKDVRKYGPFRNTRGAVLAVEDDAGNRWRGAYGFCFGKSINCNVDDRFNWGSNSKTFCATLVMKLRDEGKLSLNDKLSDYGCSSQWGCGFGLDQANSITIQHLLAHESGYPYVPSYDLLHILKQVLPIGYDNENFIDAAQDDTVLFKPGTDGQYSNLNYVVLAMIIEEITGQPYHTYLKSEIFDALDMGNSFSHDQGPQQKHVDAWDPLNLINIADIANRGLYGVSGVMAPIDDMLTWFHALLTGNVVPTATLNEMKTLRHDLFGARLGLNDYGYALIRADLADGTIVYTHGGAAPGYTTIVGYIPSSRHTIALGLNTQFSDYIAFFYDVLGAITGIKTSDPIDFALNRAVSASSTYGDYVAANAVDGANNTYWYAAPTDATPWLQVDLGKVRRINQIVVDEHTRSKIKDFELQYKHGSDWIPVVAQDNGAIGRNAAFTFTPPVETRSVRLYITDYAKTYVAIDRLEVYLTSDAGTYAEKAKDDFDTDKTWCQGTGWKDRCWSTDGELVSLAGFRWAKIQGSEHLQRAVDLSGLNGQVWLRYKHKVFSNWQRGDEAYVQVSTDDTNWTTLKTYTISDADGKDHWQELDISSYAGEPHLQIRFQGGMDSAVWDSWRVDDVEVLYSAY